MTQSGGQGEDIKNALMDRLRNLASNIAAISTGRGKPGELIDQIVRVAESLIIYNEEYGTRPEEELIRQALADFTRQALAD